VKRPLTLSLSGNLNFTLGRAFRGSVELFLRARNAASSATLALAALTAFLLGFGGAFAHGQPGAWSLVSGGNVNNHAGVYGTLGTPAAGNMPGGRAGSAFWTDNKGNFWVLGGRGFDSNGNYAQLNDLWEYQPTFTALTAVVSAGSSATYPVTLPSGMTNPTATCQNLPAAAACSYSSGTVIITTSAATPKGTYQITVLLSQTVAGAASASIFLPILLLPLVFLRRRMVALGVWNAACLGLVLAVATAFATSCGGGSSSSTPTPAPTPTHQVTSSGIVTLTVQ